MGGPGPLLPAREVELDDIIWQGVLDGADDARDVLVETHLALEAILIEMLWRAHSVCAPMVEICKAPALRQQTGQGRLPVAGNCRLFALSGGGVAVGT